MAKQTETRLFTGGIDANTAPFAMEQGSVLNAVNIRALLSDRQHTGELQALAGNEAIATLATGSILLGKEAAPEINAIFYIYYNATGSFIARFNRDAGTVQTIINDARVTGGLGFAEGMHVSAAVVDDKLFWTDGYHDIRYINLSVDYMTGPVYSQSGISLITEPPMVPLEVSRDSVAGINSSIQNKSVQFAYRFVLSDGFYSVLSPRSLTSFAIRESAVLLDATEGTVIDVVVPLSQNIPANWKYVEMIAYFPDTNAFHIIKRWSASIIVDVAEVTLHNAGTTALELTGWYGNLQELLPLAETAKQFDSIPNTAAAIEAANNRLFLGDIAEGYDTPDESPTITVTETTFSSPVIASTAAQAYIILIQEKDAIRWYFAIIVRISGKNYLLPKEASKGYFDWDPGLPSSILTLAEKLFMLPESVSEDRLIELDEQGDPDIATLGTTADSVERIVRKNIVIEANGLSSLEPETLGINWYLQEWDYSSLTSGIIDIEDDFSEYGLAGESRAFLGIPYDYGIRYYDEAGRVAGVKVLGTHSFDPYDLSVGEFVEKLRFTTPAGVQSAIPDWAKYFAITISPATRAARFGFFFGGIVKALLKNGGGEIEYRDAADLLTVPTGYSIYGIGVPIPPTFGYAFVDGDYMQYSSTATSGQAKVLGVHAGHIVLQFTNDGLMHTIADGLNSKMYWNDALNVAYGYNGSRTQSKVAFTLISGMSVDDNQYEVAAFGLITGPDGAKEFGDFFASGANYSDVYGDAHTQKSYSDSGGWLGLSMSPRINSATPLWVTDRGRVAITDRIGRKILRNAIRFSNTHIPGAATNGHASFDALDIKMVDETSGQITGMVLTTKGAQEGGQLLVLCTHGSFTALIGRQQLAGADQQESVSIAGGVISDFNALKGGYGCMSPRAIVRHQGRVWWIDVFNREVVEFGDAGAHSIAAFKASRLFQQLLTAVAESGNSAHVSLGVNPLARELMVSIPETSADPLPALATVPDLISPLDSFTNKPATFCYNYEDNKWQLNYESGAEFINLGNSVYSWDFETSTLYGEFVAAPGTYYGVEKPAMIAVPFNAMYPTVKSMRSLSLVSDRVPDKTWVMCEESGVQHVAGVHAWENRDGAWTASIRRDRTSYGAATPDYWNVSGVNGKNLKGRTAFVVMIWNAGGLPINASSLTIQWAEATGQMKKG